MLGISRDSESHSLRSLFYHFELGMQIYARQMQSRAPSQKCHGFLPLDLEAQVSRCKSGPLSLSQWLKIQDLPAHHLSAGQPLVALGL